MQHYQQILDNFVMLIAARRQNCVYTQLGLSLTDSAYFHTTSMVIVWTPTFHKN